MPGRYLRWTCILVAVLGFGFGEARAEKVDWGPYLESPGSRSALKRSTPTVVKQTQEPVAKKTAKKAPRGKAAKRAGAAQAKQSKAKRKPARRR
jgi:hypothetical protein